MARLVRFRVLDGVAVVTLDAPPVNALSKPIRGGLWEVFGRINENDDIKAAVLMASGRMFSAGADFREFDSKAGEPSLPQLCNRIEACTKPVIAAIHGQALGGGAELVLAAHYRLASPDARIGLPEVALGLIPGAGGTQRLPRLIGAERALQMMISTSAIDAGSAHRVGLVDGIVQGDLGSGAIAFAQDLVAKGQGPRPTRSNRTHLIDARTFQAAIAKVRTSLAQNPLHAPQRVVDCVEACALLPFDAALAFEEDAFERIDAAMLAYGFRKGPFGGKDAGSNDDEIARRLMAALVVEGLACLAEQAVQRPSDIDALAVHGLGYPRRCGGPLRAAQTDGLIALRKDMRIWTEQSDIWMVPELLDEAIKDAKGFDALG